MNHRPSPAKFSFAKQSTKASVVTSLAALLAACGDDDTETSSVSVPVEGGGQEEPVVVENISPDDVPVKVNLVVESANNTAISETNVDELDIVFQVSASFDAKVLDENAVINLGLDQNGAEVASLGRADFDELSIANATLNVHATQQNVEVDYKKGTDGNLTINFENSDTIQVGKTAPLSTPNTAIEVLGGKTLTINHMTNQDVFVRGATNLDDVIQDVVITTSETGGFLNMGATALFATLENSGEVQTVTIDAVQGDAYLMSVDPFHGNGHFLDDATNLQSITINAHDAAVEVGSFGQALGLEGEAIDLETVHLTVTGTGSLYQRPIVAHGSDIAEFTLIAGSVNEVFPFLTTNFFLGGAYNTVIEGLGAQKIEKMIIDTTAGGNVLIFKAGYSVGEMIITGSGDIAIDGHSNKGERLQISDSDGIVQTGPADASSHTGERIFLDGGGFDILYGSNNDDQIIFFSLPTPASPSLPVDLGGIYYDSGGDDRIESGLPEDFTAYDGSVGSNDTYVIGGNGTNPILPKAFEFYAGSGNDTIELTTAPFLFFGQHDIYLDFGTWENGTVTITGFRTNQDLISLDGMPGITANAITMVDPSIPGQIPLININDNSIYLGLDGDQVTNGATIANYESMTDVAGYLNAVAGGSTHNGDSVVFVVENGTSSSGAGDEADYYFYLFSETDGKSGISTDEITYFASVELATVGFAPVGPFTAADFV